MTVAKKRLGRRATEPVGAASDEDERHLILLLTPQSQLGPPESKQQDCRHPLQNERAWGASIPHLCHKTGTIVEVSIRTTGITVLFDGATRPTVLDRSYMAPLIEVTVTDANLL